MGSQHVHLNTFEDVWGEHEIVLKTPHLDRESIKVNLKLESTDPNVEKKPSRHHVATKARNYLEVHSVQDLLQEMVHALLAKRPDDPLDFMAEYIHGQQAKRSEQVAAQVESASPRAPPPKPSVRDPNTPGDEMLRSAPPHRVSVSETNRQSGKRRGSGSSFVSDHYTLQGLGESEYPGFPTDACPDVMPDLTGHFSFMADVLAKTPAIYEKLKTRRTKSGVSLAKVIKPGIDNKGHAMIKTTGVVAGDEETYTMFSDLLDPIINLRHGGFSEDARHTTDLDFSKVDISPVDPTGKHVVSTRMRASRNIRSFRFPSACSKDERREVERMATQALMELSGDYTGDYFPLEGSESYPSRPHGMTACESRRLEEAKMIFQEPYSALLLSTGMGRHWPDARGVFGNDPLDFVVWLNEEDHMNFHLVQKGASAVDVFTRFCHVHTVVESGLRQQGLDFMHHDRLGFFDLVRVEHWVKSSNQHVHHVACAEFARRFQGCLQVSAAHREVCERRGSRLGGVQLGEAGHL
jgi:creatine kinase